MQTSLSRRDRPSSKRSLRLAINEWHLKPEIDLTAVFRRVSHIARANGRSPLQKIAVHPNETRCKALVQCLLPLVQDLTRYLKLRERHLELRHRTSK